MLCFASLSFFFFNDTATTEIYTLSLHDALPICVVLPGAQMAAAPHHAFCFRHRIPHLALGLRLHDEGVDDPRDRKSTRLNSSHLGISYAVFCLKKKK